MGDDNGDVVLSPPMSDTTHDFVKTRIIPLQKLSQYFCNKNKNGMLSN